MGAQKLIRAEIFEIEGAQKLIPTLFSTLLRTKGVQKLVPTLFSTNKVGTRTGATDKGYSSFLREKGG